MTLEQIQFLQLTLEDVGELTKISRSTFFNTFSEQNTPANMQEYLDLAFNEKRLASELNNQNSTYYFAKVGRETVGYAKINWGMAQTDLKENDGMELERIYVLKKYQGKKVGKKLLTHIIEIAENKGMTYLWLGVWEKNEKAIQFYKHFGFTICGSHPFQVGNELQVDYIMKRTLVNRK
ncbi:MAG: GNAT family N-acetyltransferase [Chitinophagales bacterium]